MKKQITLILLFVLQITFAQTEWYASPTGLPLPIGDGSMANPWDLQTALNNTTDIQPGHTLWLRGGVYTGQFDSYLQGTATNPITVQSYTGETAVLNGNTVYYTPPIVPNPNPLLISESPGLQNRLKRFYFSLESEKKADFYARAVQNPNLIQNGLKLINLPKPAVLNVNGGFVHFKKFEVTCLGYFSRRINDNNPLPGSNFFSLEGVYNHEADNEGLVFSDLVIYNLPGSGFGEWKEAKGTRIENCLIYNNGFYASPTIGDYSDAKGHGAGIYVQNNHNFKKNIESNVIFNNYGVGVQIWSGSETYGSISDYVKFVDVQNSTIFGSGEPFQNYNFNQNILVATLDNGTSAVPCIARDINIKGNTTYFNTDLSFGSGPNGDGQPIKIGARLAAPVHNVNIEDNLFVGRNGPDFFVAADSSLKYKRNTYWGLSVYHNPQNSINNDIQNWDFSQNQYYTAYSDQVFRIHPSPYIRRSLAQWQTEFTIDISSNRGGLLSFNEYTSVKPFVNNSSKFIVSLLRRNGLNVSLDLATQVTGFSIPNGTPYRIIDVENYQAEKNLPFLNNYTGAPIVFNMQSLSYEAPQNNTVSVKTPTNFGCFIIEFDLCTNTTAALTLPTQTCITAGALTNLAQYITDAPTTGIFTGVGVSQQGSEYVFDASIAGTGTHTIAYTFQNNVGCPFITITSTINVVATCIQKPYISQTYYNTTDKFIEVKNNSDTQSINAGNYYLVMYPNGADTSLPPLPANTINLNNIPAQGVKVWKATTGGNLGYVTATDWAALDTYEGDNDIVILTTSNGLNAYNDRIDEFGATSFNTFNDNITLQQQASFVRMSCAPAIPAPTYNQEHWVYFTDTEVANATSKTNAELGRHYDKEVRFTSSNVWDDLSTPIYDNTISESLPDRSRSLLFEQNYSTLIYDSFEACSITIKPFFTLTISATNYAKVFVSVVVEPDGKLEVLNQGSLVMVYDSYNGASGTDLINLGTAATMQAEKQTVGINAVTDAVYWSSPLSAAATNPGVNDVFPFGNTTGTFRANRFYIFENDKHNDANGNNYDDDYDTFTNYDVVDYRPFSTIPNYQLEKFIPGRSYATWPPIGVNNYSILFTGEMNNGEVYVPIYKNNSATGSFPNLVGNPYPSAIDLNKLFKENESLIEPIALIWGRAIDDTPNTTNPGPSQLNYSEDNFMVYNPIMIIDPSLSANGVYNAALPISERGTLASCQSFVIRAKGTGYVGANILAGNLVFKNKMRTTLPNTTFARVANRNTATQNTTEQGNKLWVNVTDATGYTAQIGVAFLPSANATYVQDEDVKVVNGRKYNFYTQSTTEDLLIDVQDTFTEGKIIPLGITNTSTNSQMMFSFSIPKRSGIFTTQSVYLYDSVLNVFHNLSSGNYTFTSNEGIIENRFSLRFTQNNSTLAKVKETNKVVAYVNENTLTVKSAIHKIKAIEVYDIYTANTSGVLVSKKDNINALETQLPISSSYKLLNVKIQLHDGSIINTKIIK